MAEYELVIFKGQHAYVDKRYSSKTGKFEKVKTSKEIPYITIGRGKKGTKVGYSRDYQLASGFYDETSYIYSFIPEEKPPWSVFKRVAKTLGRGESMYSKATIDGKRGIYFYPEWDVLNFPQLTLKRLGKIYGVANVGSLGHNHLFLIVEG